MILTCPSCAAQFSIDPNALGANGRTVRCGKCKHQWHAARPLITQEADDLKFTAKPAGATVSAAPAEATSGIAQASITSDAPPKNETKTVKPISVNAAQNSDEDDDALLRAYSAQERPGAKRNAIIAAIILASLLSIPVFMMNTKTEPKDVQPAEHSEQAPVAASEHAAEKKDDKEIVLDGTPTTLLKEEQGRTILSIEGALINKTDKTLTVPILQAQALNAKGKVVKEWIIPIGNKEMTPGARQTFSYSMPFAEQGVVDIAFHFL